MKTINPRFIFVVTAVVVAALFRFIPHWPNFTPIAAMALFGGAYLGKRYLAYLVPLAAMFLSDLVIGFHGNMATVYIAFALTVTIGILIQKNLRFTTVMGAALGSSVLFFLITNFGAWLASPLYVPTFAGLMQSYVAGLAFFNDGNYGISFFLNEVVGTLVYSGVLFGAYYLACQRFPVLKRA